MSTVAVADTRDEHLPHRFAVAGTLAVLGVLDAGITWFLLTHPGQYTVREGNPLLLALSGGNPLTLSAASLVITLAVACALAVWRPGVLRGRAGAIVWYLVWAGAGVRAWVVWSNVVHLLAWYRYSR